MTNPQLFDLNPSDEQQMTRDVVQRFAREQMAAQARSADEAAALPANFLQQTMDLGLSIMPVPDTMGGMGAERSCVSNVLNMEDLAQGDMSMAIAALAPLAVINCLLDFGDAQQQNSVFQRVIASEFIPAAVALMEPGVAFNPEQPATTASANEQGYVLDGCKTMVAFGPDAALLLVIASLQGEPAAFIVDGNSSGLSWQRQDYMGLRPLPLYQLSLNQVQVAATAKLGGFTSQRLLDLSNIAISALAVGTCQAVLDYVVPYVNERQAFGEPIANRQAVAFMVADMATELEGLRLLCWRAASRADQGLEFTEAAFLARRAAVKYGMQIGTNGVQLLGGHGFTREHPVEMWYRNLRALATLDGILIA